MTGHVAHVYTGVLIMDTICAEKGTLPLTWKLHAKKKKLEEKFSLIRYRCKLRGLVVDTYFFGGLISFISFVPEIGHLFCTIGPGPVTSAMISGLYLRCIKQNFSSCHLFSRELW